jgi:HPt (histidine-containing phosphotransfer) domain-containing protein
MEAMILATFIQDAPSKMEDIRTALDAGDVEGVRKAAHAYKSACGTIHAGPLEQVLRELESAAAGNQAAELDRLVRDAQTRHDEALGFLSRTSTSGA